MINIKKYTENDTCEVNKNSYRFYQCSYRAEYVINSKLYCYYHAKQIAEKNNIKLNEVK